MSRVNIEGDAFNDCRFARLARRVGFSDPDLAIIKMARLWLQCTTQEKKGVLPEDAAMVFGVDEQCIVDALEFSNLGTLRDDGEIYLAGADDRLGWLAQKRKAGRLGGKKGGRPRKAKRDSALSRTEAERKAHLKQNETPPAPAPAPVRDPPSEDLVSEVEPEPGPDPDPPPKPALPPEAYNLADLLRDLIREYQGGPGGNDTGSRETRPRAWPATRERWAGELDKLHRLDGHTWSRIEHVMRWAKADVEFWSGNILSAGKLREKFDQLAAKARLPAKRNGTRGVSRAQEIYAEALAMEQAEAAEEADT